MAVVVVAREFAVVDFVRLDTVGYLIEWVDIFCHYCDSWYRVFFKHIVVGGSRCSRKKFLCLPDIETGINDDCQLQYVQRWLVVGGKYDWW